MSASFPLYCRGVNEFTPRVGTHETDVRRNGDASGQRRQKHPMTRHRSEHSAERRSTNVVNRKLASSLKVCRSVINSKCNVSFLNWMKRFPEDEEDNTILQRNDHVQQLLFSFSKVHNTMYSKQEYNKLQLY